MKRLLLIPLLILPLTACHKVEIESVEGGEEIVKKELINDNAFLNGFDLLTPSTNNGRNLSGVLNYNGESKGSPKWQMAQWWTHNDFINADFKKVSNGIFDYQNDSRHLFVNQNTKTIQMDLNSHVEYQALYGRTRKSNESWSHFLIEQNFDEPEYLNKLSEINVHLEFVINKSIDMDEGQEVPCSQVTWYFTITDVKNGDARYESGNNDFFWFGIPLYDSRYEYVNGYKNVDSGFEGATNKLIYSMDNKDVLKTKVEVGKKIVLDYDILPEIKKAFLFGLERGAMANSDWKDLCINYMNLGWELPGAYDVSLSVSNISVICKEK